MTSASITIGTEIGFAIGGDGFCMSGVWPARPDIAHDRFAEVLEVAPLQSATITFCAPPSPQRDALEDAVLSALDVKGVSVVYASRTANRETWLGAPDGTDGQMLEEADRRSFRDEYLAEVEALAGLDAAFRREARQ